MLYFCAAYLCQNLFTTFTRICTWNTEIKLNLRMFAVNFSVLQDSGNTKAVIYGSEEAKIEWFNMRTSRTHSHCLMSTNKQTLIYYVVELQECQNISDIRCPKYTMTLVEIAPLSLINLEWLLSRFFNVINFGQPLPRSEKIGKWVPHGTFEMLTYLVGLGAYIQQINVNIPVFRVSCVGRDTNLWPLNHQSDFIATRPVVYVIKLFWRKSRFPQN